MFGLGNLFHTVGWAMVGWSVGVSVNGVFLAYGPGALKVFLLANPSAIPLLCCGVLILCNQRKPKAGHS
jgi:hypothetical protein